MQYVPGNHLKPATGLFEVSAELCSECCRKPLVMQDLLVKLVADEPRKAYPEYGP
jgi:hypothetical protein